MNQQYTICHLFQTSKTLGSWTFDVASATNTATVTVNSNPAWRHGDYFYGGDTADNSASALMKELVIVATHSNLYSAATGHIFVAQTPEQFQYDADGNLTQDGRFTYAWDAENRLVGVTTRDNLPATVLRVKLTYAYDHQSRRIASSKSLWTNDAWQAVESCAFIYDGWNVIAETITASQITTTNHYVWGLDLSGSLQGAGGIGGLHAIHMSPSPLGNNQSGGDAITPYYPLADANGNITAYVEANGDLVAQREYDVYGNSTSVTGSMYNYFSLWFSSKYLDEGTGLYYYGYRYYSPNFARFISRDPADDDASYLFLEDVADLFTLGEHVYGFTENRPVTQIDPLGLAYGNPVPPVVISPPPISPPPSKPDSSCPKKCCNGKMVQMVPIWTCTRALGEKIKIGPIKHGYICCSGVNNDCFGIQKYKPSCMEPCLKSYSKKYCQKLCYAKRGDPIEPEGKPSGTCTMSCVTPDEKNAAGDNPSMPWDYSICKWQHCYSWADDVTSTKCK